MKILYVDDEAMALKYFERLVSPLAPVITATSVEEGREMLRLHGNEIGVLVSDQRMPGERGNELLRFAREHHPGIVRMLTTAYSELGEAIEAINAGEIYRYINKPWALDSLRTDLKNALELAELRRERDGLMREKMLAHQGQLLGNRLSQLLGVLAALRAPQAEAALHAWAATAQAVGAPVPEVDWRRWDHADLLQAEARRTVQIALAVQEWLRLWGTQAADPLAALAAGWQVPVAGGAIELADPAPLSRLLHGAAGSEVSPADAVWLAWLLWRGGAARVEAVAGGWRIAPAEPLPRASDWLADAIERLGPLPG
jgi:two-component system probable response regulator PhcQ